MTVAIDYLDLDIWMAERVDGRVYAYTHDEPQFLTASGDVDDVLGECRAALRIYAQTAGHDLRFSLRTSLRPEGLPVPRDALPLPIGGARIVGRVVIGALSASGGPDPLAGDALGAFLARGRGPTTAPGRQGPAPDPR